MTAGGGQPAGLTGERDSSLRRQAQRPEHLATVTAACRRCIADGNAQANPMIGGCRVVVPGAGPMAPIRPVLSGLRRFVWAAAPGALRASLAERPQNVGVL